MAVATHPFARDLCRIVLPRVLVAWVALTLILYFMPDPTALVGMGAVAEGSGGDARWLGPPLRVAASLLNAAGVTLFITLDLRATRLQLLLANLGVGLRAPATIAVIATLALELLLQTAQFLWNVLAA
jgi:hypothetical protein